MTKVENKRIERAFVAYYGISREEYLAVLLKENGYKQFSEISPTLLESWERYPTTDFEQRCLEDYVRHHQKGNQQGVARKRLQRA